MEAPGYEAMSAVGVGFQNPKSEGMILKIAPMPIPLKIFAALVPPVSPAFRISAHAVPSGNRRFPCSFTIRYRRRGIIIRTPRIPPVRAMRSVSDALSAYPRKISAGTVKTTAAAIDSPAEPTV